MADSNTLFIKRYINSSTSNDIIGARINPSDGTINYLKFFRAAPASEFIYKVKSSRFGGFTLVGSTWSFSAGQDDYLIMRLDDSLNLLWSKSFGFSENDFYTSVAEDPAGILLSGTSFRTSYWWNIFLVKLDTLGNMQWYRYFSTSGNYTDAVYDAIYSSDGYYVLTGHVCVSDCDILIMKISPSGGTLSYRVFGTSGLTETGFAVVDVGGYYYVFGRRMYSSDSSDILVLKVDSSLNLVWAKSYEGPSYKQPTYAKVLSDGNILIGGFIYTSPYAYLWLSKMDTSGNILFSFKYDSITASNTDKVTFYEYNGDYIVSFGGFVGRIRYDGHSPCTYTNFPLTQRSYLPRVVNITLLSLSGTPTYQTPFFTYTPDSLPYSSVCISTDIYEGEKICRRYKLKGNMLILDTPSEFDVYDASGRMIAKGKGKYIPIRKGVNFVVVRSGDKRRVIKITKP